MNREKELWEKMEGKEVRIDWLSAKLRSIYDSGCKFHGYVMMFSKRQLEVFEGGQSVVLWGYPYITSAPFVFVFEFVFLIFLYCDFFLFLSVGSNQISFIEGRLVFLAKFSIQSFFCKGAPFKVSPHL